MWVCRKSRLVHKYSVGLNTGAVYVASLRVGADWMCAVDVCLPHQSFYTLSNKGWPTAHTTLFVLYCNLKMTDTVHEVYNSCCTTWLLIRTVNTSVQNYLTLCVLRLSWWHDTVKLTQAYSCIRCFRWLAWWSWSLSVKCQLIWPNWCDCHFIRANIGFVCSVGSLYCGCWSIHHKHSVLTFRCRVLTACVKREESGPHSREFSHLVSLIFRKDTWLVGQI